MPADISAIAYFAPVFSFLIVFAIVFAVLLKTKVLGENNWGLLFVSFLIATIFISAAGVKDYVLTIVPWFAVLVISVFFILLLAGFIGKVDFLQKPMQVGVLIILLIIFLVSGFVVFSDIVGPYLPGPAFGLGDVDPATFFFLDWLYSARVVGAIALLVAAALASWILVKSAS